MSKPDSIAPVGPGVIGVVDEKGNLLKQRVPTADQARALLYFCLTADQLSMQARTEAQAELDGQRPYDPMALSAVGQNYRTNYNFRTMRIIREKVAASLREVWDNPEFISVQTRFGDDARRPIYSDILSSEITQMVKSMPGFTSIITDLLHYFSFHGFGLAYFEDPDSWFFKAGSLNEFAFERKVKPDSKTLEVVFATRTLRAHELYDYVRDPQTAREAGWDVEEVMKVLRTASYNQTVQPQRVSWETEKMLKNGDYTLTDIIGTSIPISHMWVREFDGTVTHSIFFVNGNGGNSQDVKSDKEGNVDDTKFLYTKYGAYDSMEQAFVLFPLGSSTNGDIHALRGYGNDLLPHTRVIDKLMNQATDAAFLGMALNVMATNESSRLSAMVNPMGAYTILDPSVQIQSNATPNLQQVAGMPLTLLQSQIRERLGEIDVNADGGMGRTQLEAEIRMGNASKVSNNIMDMLLEHLSILLREIVRRVVRKDYDEGIAGAEERKRMIARLTEAGVPVEALYEIDLDSITALPPIGAGSKVRRTLALRQCLNYMQFMPRAGQERLVRMAIANETNGRTARLLMPLKDDPNPSETIAASIASMQNNQLLAGQEVPVMPNEDHRTHAEVHANYILSLVPDAQLSPEEMAQLAQPLQLLVSQLAGHMDYLQASKEVVPEFEQYEKLVKRCNEVITNGMRALEAMQAQQQAEGAEGEGPTPEQMKAQADIELKRMKTEAEIKLAEEKQQAEIAAKTVEANAKAAANLGGTNV